MNKLLIALLLSQSLPVAQQTGSIEGFVIEAGSGKPIVKAQVSLSRSGTRGEALSATTNSGGRFLFTNVFPGQYRLTATRNGYVRTEYGQRSLNRPGLPLTVNPGQTMQNALLYVIPAGTIAGRVFDMDGEALAGVTVQAFKYVYQNGERVLNAVQNARTNDLGEYRLYWLNPGQYYVSATYNSGPLGGVLSALPLPPGGPGGPAGPGGPGALGVLAGPGGAQIRAAVESAIAEAGAIGEGRVAAFLAEEPQGDETYIPVYYPGTTDVESAAPIDLRPGTVYNGIDMTVEQARTLRVRGQVLGTNGQPAQNAVVTLVPRQRVAVSMNNRFRGRRLNLQGTFEIRGVVPGAYDVVAFVNDRNGSMSARVPIEVGSSDIENVTLAVTPGFSIPGRVSLEGLDLTTDISRLRVSLAPRTPMFGPGGRGGGNGPGPLKADGTFMLQNIGPGDYRLNIPGMPRNSYIKAARLGSTDVLDSGLKVDGPPPAGLEILISGNTGSLSGTVLDEKQNPSVNVIAVLVPDLARRHRSDLYRTTNTDALGKFHVDGIPPGDYRAFAWEDVETGAWQDPDFLRIHEDRGKSVRITEKGQDTVELRVIPFGN
jgi:protocatechuate 3,4-dioxygenase beta subunit